MLEWILPPSFLAMLKFLRCDKTRLPSGELLELNMISTMGNGFTFPLQSLLFSTVVAGVYSFLRKSGLRHLSLVRTRRRKGGSSIRFDGSIASFDERAYELGNFSVFGDDIIVDKSAARYVIRALNLLGFVVNTDKTFVEGPFRESCGADFFKGTDVRGIYVKSLNTLQDLFVAINSLNRWSARTGVYLPNACSYLLSWVRHPRRFIVPPDESDIAGIHLPQRYAYLRSNKPHTEHPGQSGYVSFVPLPREYEFTETSILVGNKIHTSRVNWSGAYVTFLYGSIRGRRISIRSKEVRYGKKRKFTPSWGSLNSRAPSALNDYADGCRRFVSACEGNLNLFPEVDAT
jgi:hypothetical protein